MVSTISPEQDVVSIALRLAADQLAMRNVTLKNVSNDIKPYFIEKIISSSKELYIFDASGLLQKKYYSLFGDLKGKNVHYLGVPLEKMGLLDPIDWQKIIIYSEVVPGETEQHDLQFAIVGDQSRYFIEMFTAHSSFQKTKDFIRSIFGVHQTKEEHESDLQELLKTNFDTEINFADEENSKKLISYLNDLALHPCD